MVMTKPMLWLTIGLGLSLSACIPPKEEEVLTQVRYDIAEEAIFQTIYNFQDRLLSDSIYPYFRNPDPTWRRVAALAFASIRDSSAVDSLAILLRDPIGEVRAAAAYALGQTGFASAEPYLVNAFDAYDSLGLSLQTNAAILEAIGKCGSIASLEHLSTIRSYQSKDTLLLLGQARGIYRFGLRGMTSDASIRRMAELALKPVYPNSARLIAAHYLARIPKIQIDTFSRDLARMAPQEPDPNIRMALATALGKVNKTIAQDTLLSWFSKENDYRVKVNQLRALARFDYARSRMLVFATLFDPNEHVSLQAAQFLRDFGSPADASTYWKVSKDTLLNPPVKAMLLAAAQRHVPKGRDTLRIKINADNRARFTFAQKTYNKVAYLRALGENPWNYRLIFKIWTEEKHPALKSTAIEALAAMSTRADFEKQFGLGNRKIVAEFAQMFKTVLKSADAGPMAIAAGALRDPVRNYRQVLDSLTFLDTALTVLKLPRDQETYQEIQQTAYYLKTGKTPPKPDKPAFNHPIDWQQLNVIRSNPSVTLITSKGTIKLELLPQHAPGSVANFVTLVRKGYYNGKNFHRVVPNFVIQGGCPRGDGYGSLDYTIRSELGPVYYDAEGYVGMASAGNHTEGVQFFITHSPAPHLDGNYTIFARVRSGMEIVHDIQPGDLLEKVVLDN